MDKTTPQIDTAQVPLLTIFYDGYCSLCVSEMRQLRELDDAGEGPARLQLEDIQQADFRQRYPAIDPAAADRVLHGRLADGRMIYGLDVSCRAWSLVGQKRWLRLLRWPVLRWFADLAYWLFARNRYRLSWLLTGQRRCQRCQLNPGQNRAAN